MTDYLSQADAYLRTAEAALDAKDYGPAFENARTAAELAAKHMISQKGVPPKIHDVSKMLVDQGRWPAGKPHTDLSRLLGSTRGVYGFDEPVRQGDAAKAIVLAKAVLTEARKRSGA